MAFVFTSETAGVMAQVLAIVILANAYDPFYRGSVGAKVIRDDRGRYHSIPVRWGLSRLWLIGIATTMIAVDSILIAVDSDVRGWLGLTVAVLNSAPVGGLALMIFMSIRRHSQVNHEDQGDEQGHAREHGQ